MIKTRFRNKTFFNTAKLKISLQIQYLESRDLTFLGLGDEIDPAMMSALMATTALVAQGASNQEVQCVSLSLHGQLCFIIDR